MGRHGVRMPEQGEIVARIAAGRGRLLGRDEGLVERELAAGIRVRLRDTRGYAFELRRSVQVHRAEEPGLLWLETPDAATRSAPGRPVTPAEAGRMLETLAREDRSAVEELGDLRTVSW